VSIPTGGLGVNLLPPDQERALTRPGATRMRHSPERPASKSYMTFWDADTAADVMIGWLQLAAATAPATTRR
jgi:hypothetical protein